MATEEETQQQEVGLDDVNFRGLGQEPGGETKQVISSPGSLKDEEGKDEPEQSEEEPKDKSGNTPSGELSEEEDQDEEESEEEDTPSEEEEDSSQESDEEQQDEPSGEEEESSDEESDDDESEGEPVGIFETTAEQLGVDLEDERFEDIDFEDPDTNDLSEFIDRASKQMSEKRWEKQVEENPEFEGFYEYVQNGGDPRQYIETMYPQVDYTQVDYEEHVAGNEDAQEQLVRNELAEQGYEQEEIEEEIEDYRNGGILERKAKRSLNKLQQWQEKQQKELVEQQKEEARRKREQQKEEQEEVKTMIDESDDIRGLNIPETDKEDLKKYLFEAVDEEGYSQAYKDGQQLTKEDQLAIAYLKMKDFDFSELIENEAESKNAKRIKDNIKKSKKDSKPSGSSKSGNNKSSQGSIQDITPVF